MVLALIFSAIFLLPVATVLLPRLLLPPWFLALLLGSMWLWQQLEGADGPGGFFAYVLVSLFTVTNGGTAFVRIGLILVRCLAMPKEYGERG